MNKLFKLAASAVMLASMCTPVLAAPLVSDDGIHYTESTIDTTATGSLTIQKLLRGEFVTHQGTGQPEDVSKRFKIGGVKFKTVKIADLTDMTSGGRMVNPISVTLTAGNESKGMIGGSYYTNIIEDGGLNTAIAEATGNDTGYYTAEELSTAISQIAGNAESREILNSLSGTEITTSYDGIAKFDSLPLGLYIVIETDSSGAYIDANGNGAKDDDEEVTVASETEPYLVSIPMTNQAVLDSHEVGTVWQYDVTSYPKNATTEAEKVIVENRKSFGKIEKNVSEADYMIGEDHVYVVSNLLPKREESSAEYTKFTIKDTAENLAIDYKTPLTEEGEGSFFVALSSDSGYSFMEYGTDYTVTGTQYKDTNRSTDFSATFTASGLAKINEMTKESEVTLLIGYQAYITPEAVVGSTSNNINETEFSWEFSNGTTGTIKTNKTQVYTYGIQLVKSGVENPENVKFTVEMQPYALRPDSLDQENMNFYKEADGVYRVASEDDDTETLVKEISPSAEGTLQIKGLDDAYCYKFTEVKTDTGANLLKEPFVVYLVASSTIDGTLGRAGVTSGDEIAENLYDNVTLITVDDGYAFLEVNNTPAPILETGGKGLISVIAIAGAAGVFAISFYILYKRAKKEEEEEESSEQE